MNIEACLKGYEDWVVEGCYTDLLELLVQDASEIIFMDLPVEQCIANAKSRPWEPHKYESKQAQDANLEMLLAWIQKYKARSDSFSYEAHRNFYDTFQGKKTIYTENQEHR